MPSCLQPAALCSDTVCSVAAAALLSSSHTTLIVETLRYDATSYAIVTRLHTHTTVRTFKMRGWVSRVNISPVSPSQLANLMYLSAGVIDNLVSCDVKLKAAEPSYYRHAALPSSCGHCGQPSQVGRLQIVHVDM